MGNAFPDFLPLLHHGTGFCTEIAVRETIPNVFHRHPRRMEHIIGIETIITKFVHHDFIGREIMAIGTCPTKFIGCQEQSSLAQLIGMHSILGMADRADGKHHFQFGIDFSAFFQNASTFFHKRLGVLPQTPKRFVRHLVAIAYHLTFADIDVGRTPSHDQPIGFLQFLGSFLQPGIDATQTFPGSGSREIAMMHPAVPQATSLEKVLFHICFP